MSLILACSLSSTVAAALAEGPSENIDDAIARVRSAVDVADAETSVGTFSEYNVM
jgi:hypothetical protein